LGTITITNGIADYSNTITPSLFGLNFKFDEVTTSTESVGTVIPVDILIENLQLTFDVDNTSQESAQIDWQTVL